MRGIEGAGGGGGLVGGCGDSPGGEAGAPASAFDDALVGWNA